MHDCLMAITPRSRHSSRKGREFGDVVENGFSREGRNQTGSPLDQAVFTIIAAIAQRKRSLIAERVRAGLRRPRAECKRLGCRPLQVDPAMSRALSAVRSRAARRG